MHEVQNRGFPQSVKSQKSVCGVALQIGFFAFYFRKWGTTCYACQYESSPLSEVWQKAPFYQIFRKEVRLPSIRKAPTIGSC